LGTVAKIARRNGVTFDFREVLIMAISFDRYGLNRLGSQAIQRGLQLIEIEGNKEGLRSQLRDSQKDMETGKVKDSEPKITPLVLTRFREALSLKFEAGQQVPIPLLFQELVPDMSRVPVKNPLTPREFPLPQPEHILPQLLEDRMKDRRIKKEDQGNGIRGEKIAAKTRHSK